MKPSHPSTVLCTDRLTLTPLGVSDAGEMVAVLADPALYRFTGGSPPDLHDLTARYRSQIDGPGGSNDEAWYNWIVRLRTTEEAVGFMQATIRDDTADIAWVIGTAWQRRGFATEAATAMCGWLCGSGIREFKAHIHPDHVASRTVATMLGLRNSEAVDDDGEEVWSMSVRDMG